MHLVLVPSSAFIQGYPIDSPANLVETCSIVIPRTGGHPLMNHNFVDVPTKMDGSMIDVWVFLAKTSLEIHSEYLKNPEYNIPKAEQFILFISVQ